VAEQLDAAVIDALQGETELDATRRAVGEEQRAGLAQAFDDPESVDPPGTFDQRPRLAAAPMSRSVSRDRRWPDISGTMSPDRVMVSSPLPRCWRTGAAPTRLLLGWRQAVCRWKSW